MRILWQVTDPEGCKVQLTDEGWKHTCERHPECKRLFREVGEAVKHPDKIYRSETSNNHYIYQKKRGKLYITVITFSKIKVKGKFVAIWREVDTAYLDDEEKKGVVTWPKKIR